VSKTAERPIDGFTEEPSLLDGAGQQESRLGGALRPLSPARIGTIYVILAMIIAFGILSPTLFLSPLTAIQVANGSAITALAALALLIPLASGVFDLSFAYTMSLAGVTTAFFYGIVEVNLILSMLCGLLISLAVGVINGIVVVVVGIDSFIGTLATGLLVMATITLVTGGLSVNSPRLGGAFSEIAQGRLFGVTYPVYYTVGLAFILWLVLSHTVLGRRIYASGFNLEAARLAGIKVRWIRFGALMTSALIAGGAGIVLASSLSSGSPTAGNPFLLSAFAACFVGATQFKPGLFNAWGTIAAVMMLGTGAVGLSLVRAPAWAGDMFTGLVLLLALAAHARSRSATRSP
jgi:ribose transport system permease protein